MGKSKSRSRSQKRDKKAKKDKKHEQKRSVEKKKREKSREKSPQKTREKSQHKTRDRKEHSHRNKSSRRSYSPERGSRTVRRGASRSPPKNSQQQSSTIQATPNAVTTAPVKKVEDAEERERKIQARLARARLMKYAKDSDDSDEEEKAPDLSLISHVGGKKKFKEDEAEKGAIRNAVTTGSEANTGEANSLQQQQNLLQAQGPDGGAAAEGNGRTRQNVFGFVDSDGLEDVDEDDFVSRRKKEMAAEAQQKIEVEQTNDAEDKLDIELEVEKTYNHTTFSNSNINHNNQWQLGEQQAKNAQVQQSADAEDDPLEQFMSSIKGQAVEQIDDRVNTSHKNRVISYEEIMGISDLKQDSNNVKDQQKQSLKRTEFMVDDDDDDNDDDDDGQNHVGNENNGNDAQDNQTEKQKMGFKKESKDQLQKNAGNENNNNNDDDDDGYDDDVYYKKFQEQMKEQLAQGKRQKGGEFMSDDSAEEQKRRENGAGGTKKGSKEEEEDDIFNPHRRSHHDQQRKDLKPVDHTKMQYAPFRKNFYIEAQEITSMTPEEVEQYRKDLGEIVVRGKDVPRPIKNWYQCGLSDLQVKILLERKNFDAPFAIQCQCLPVIMSGRDTIGIAETGSGKTMAYVLPMLRHVADQPPLEDGEGPVALVIAPTRELADQIFRETRSVAKPMGLNVVCVYGGAGIKAQLTEVKKGAEIVVATPGRLIDILTTSNGKVMNLARVTFVVIDEADRMLDQGFEPQLMKVLNNVRPDRQTVMFSATFPRVVENLAKNILRRPVEVIVGRMGQAGRNIKQIVEVREESTKLRRLLEILGDWQDKGSVLIFVDKQSEADELYRELLKYGYPSLLLHGGVDATDREFTIHDFKKQVLNIMVATSICARGLDIPHISLVINFQAPNHMEDYIHRVGRTGRAGRAGTAITFITKDEERYSLDIRRALINSGNEVPEELNELCNSFKKKVESGEARVYVNQFLAGKGFKFDQEEQSKAEASKATMKKKLELEGNVAADDHSSDSGDIFLQTQKRKEVIKERTVNQKLNMIKDPVKRQAIMQEGFKAAQQAILAGMPSNQVMQEAQNAIKTALNAYNPNKNSDAAQVEEAAGLLEKFDREQKEDADIVFHDLEINDYPPQIRQKLMHREFLANMQELTSCHLMVRGIHVEYGKKPPPGHKKLHIRIEGDAKSQVVACYKEIKRVIEEQSMRTLSLALGPGGGGAGGNRPGHYSVA